MCFRVEQGDWDQSPFLLQDLICCVWQDGQIVLGILFSVTITKRVCCFAGIWADEVKGKKYVVYKQTFNDTIALWERWSWELSFSFMWEMLRLLTPPTFFSTPHQDFKMRFRHMRDESRYDILLFSYFYSHFIYYKIERTTNNRKGENITVVQ